MVLPSVLVCCAWSVCLCLFLFSGVGLSMDSAPSFMQEQTRPPLAKVENHDLRNFGQRQFMKPSQNSGLVLVLTPGCIEGDQDQTVALVKRVEALQTERQVKDSFFGGLQCYQPTHAPLCELIFPAQTLEAETCPILYIPEQGFPIREFVHAADGTPPDAEALLDFVLNPDSENSRDGDSILQLKFDHMYAVIEFELVTGDVRVLYQNFPLYFYAPLAIGLVVGLVSSKIFC